MNVKTVLLEYNEKVLFCFFQKSRSNSLWAWVKLLAVSSVDAWVSLVAQMLKSLLAMQETQVQSLGGEDPLKKEIATHFSILAWRIPWRRSLVGYSPWGHKGSEILFVGAYLMQFILL